MLNKIQLEIEQKLLDAKKLIAEAEELARENGIYVSCIDEIFGQCAINAACTASHGWDSSSC